MNADLAEWNSDWGRKMSISHTAEPEPESRSVRDLRQGVDIPTGEWSLRRTLLFVVSVSMVLWSMILLAGWLLA